MSVKWNGERVRAVIVERAMARAERVAKLFAKMLKQNLSTPGPEPSKPGEYPHKQSGKLKSSIRVVKRNQYRVDVVVGADYAKYVESIRPFVSRTVAEGKAALEREAKRKGRR